MSIRILHLYPEAMNLYGEYGNVAIIEKYMKEEGAEVTVDRISCGEEFDPESYDFIYIGCGTEYASYQVLDALIPYKESLKKYIESGKILLATGNSFELFGKLIKDDTAGEKEGLAIFDFIVKRTHKKRFLGDALFTEKSIVGYIVGFINKCSLIFDIKKPLFEIKMGLGNDNTKTLEGYTENNFYGTNLIGPLLVRNPNLCRKFMDLIYENVGFEPIEKADMTLQDKAYSVAVKELLQVCEEAN